MPLLIPLIEASVAAIHRAAIEQDIFGLNTLHHRFSIPVQSLRRLPEAQASNWLTVRPIPWRAVLRSLHRQQR